MRFSLASCAVAGVSLAGCAKPVTLEADVASPPIEASAIPEVRLSLGAGSITVESSEDGSIVFSAHRRVTGKDEAAARQQLESVRIVPLRDSDGALRVSIDGPEGATWSADLMARVPATVRVVAETGRGAIHLGSRVASVRATAREGDVDVDSRPAPGSRVELESTHGSVTCRVPRFLSAHYNLRVENGSIRSEAAPFRVPAGATSFSTTTGPDATSIHLHAANGDVTVEGS
ncbi:MAG: hypothetical protein HYR85_12140 [Planctomycetes bacterium]|nr:hypothetical protein [Planctomycetota bacterium]